MEQTGRGERIDHNSLAELRDEAHRDGDLERVAQLSREPNVHLGLQTLQDVSGEKKGDSFLQQKAERVEKHNRGLAQERGGINERIEQLVRTMDGNAALAHAEALLREITDEIKF